LKAANILIPTLTVLATTPLVSEEIIALNNMVNRIKIALAALILTEMAIVMQLIYSMKILHNGMIRIMMVMGMNTLDSKVTIVH
jgi:hypothetical protein